MPEDHNASTTTATTRRKRVTRDVWVGRIADHVLTNGVGSLSVRTVAAKFGVTAQALLNHFGSKEELLQDVLHGAVYRDLLVMQNMINKMTSVDQLITDMLRGLRRASFRRMFAVQVELFAVSALDPEQYSNFSVRTTRIGHKQFELQARRDGVPEDQVQSVSGMMLATLRGMVLEALGGLPPARLDEMGNQLRRWYAAQCPGGVPAARPLAPDVAGREHRSISRRRAKVLNAG